MRRNKGRYVLMALVCGAVVGFSWQSSLYAQSSVASARSATDARDASALFARPVSVQLDRVSVKQAVNALAASAGVHAAYSATVIEAVSKSVTLHAKNIPLGAAMDRVLAGTHLRVQVMADVIKIEPEVGGEGSLSGVILGTVVDAKTKQPVSGANVALDGATNGVMTSANGTFRIVAVAAGQHSVRVKRIGYSVQTVQVSVTDGAEASVSIALEPSANTLDQVVVTGTVVQTALKAVPNAITVITAKQIEERGITHVEQLFRGEVPGLFALNQGSNGSALLDEVTMFSRGATALSNSSAGSNRGTNPIKTYVDGIELANAQYLSQIDPKSIERIEILTGPQASTIYGSNAINGVMQIFTKRGTSNTPQLTLNLLSGWVENNFRSTRTPQHDYSAQVNGLEGRIAYNAGGSWNYIGPWTPAKQTARTNASGGARFDGAGSAGRMAVDIMFRRAITLSRQRGSINQLQTDYGETGWYNYSSTTSGLSQPTVRILTGQTLGLALSYRPVSWWSHEFGLGQDVSDVEIRRVGRGYTSIGDTTLVFQQNPTDRRSMRYTTTASISIATRARMTATVGADAWQSMTSTTTVSPQTLTGSLTGSTSISRQPGHNTGSFLQSQLDLSDRVFFTYGLRAEWNPTYGEAAQPNYAPRYGVAYTQDLGEVTVKLRSSYGRSTRPPLPQLKVAQTIADLYGVNWSSNSSFFLPYYGGIFDYSFANPELAPEHQQGGEGGLEMYFGTRGSLIITRYNQMVDGLIAQPIVDSIRSLVPCASGCSASSRDPAGYGYTYQYQYINVGSVRNQGWELQSSVTTGPLTARGTYSWTKSRSLGMNPRYRAQFSPTIFPQYQPGATFLYLPEHTWALGLTYGRKASSVGLTVTGTGRIANFQDDFYNKYLSNLIRLSQNRQNTLLTQPGPYISMNRGYALADLSASHHITDRLEGVLQIQNLADRYTNDVDARQGTMGRQTRLGIRFRSL